MRKRTMRKRRSCALCNPHKQGWECRWRHSDLGLLQAFESDRMRFLRGDDSWREQFDRTLTAASPSVYLSN